MTHEMAAKVSCSIGKEGRQLGNVFGRGKSRYNDNDGVPLGRERGMWRSRG